MKVVFSKLEFRAHLNGKTFDRGWLGFDGFSRIFFKKIRVNPPNR
jgi:hypothetical protein